MTPPLGFMARRVVQRSARKAAFGGAAVVCLCVGLGFLISAAWIALSIWRSPLFASLIMGAVLVGIGLILLAVALARPKTIAQEWAEEFDPDALHALNRAAAGGQGQMEEALRGLLGSVGLATPAAGNMPALAAAFVFGLTLALGRNRARRRRR